MDDENIKIVEYPFEIHGHKQVRILMSTKLPFKYYYTINC